MKENIIVLILSTMSSLAITYNPNPSVDWHSMLVGLAVAAVSCAVIFAGKSFSRIDIMLAIYVFAVCFTEFEKLDKYAFFFGIGLCSLILVFMLLFIRS